MLNLISLAMVLANPATPAPTETQSNPVDVVAAASQDGLPIEQLLDEMLTDLGLELARLDARDISPLALRRVILPSMLSTELGQMVRAQTHARLTQVEGLSLVQCMACSSVRTRVEGGEWVVRRGVVDGREARRVGEEIGAAAFLDLTLDLVDDETRLVLYAEVVRVSTSAVILAKRFDADETTAALSRNGRRLETAETRRAELEAMWQGKPTYGHAGIVGMVRIPYESPDFDGAISGVSLAYRLYELFGARRANLFGLQMEGFYDPSLNHGTKQNIPTAGGMFSAVYLRSLLADDQRWPTVRLGINAGGFIGGTLGNTVFGGGLVEVMMRYRLAINTGVFYVVPATVEELDGRIGGLCFRAGGSFNWE
jgi:hypothetical protein